MPNIWDIGPDVFPKEKELLPRNDFEKMIFDKLDSVPNAEPTIRKFKKMILNNPENLKPEIKEEILRKIEDFIKKWMKNEELRVKITTHLEVLEKENKTRDAQIKKQSEEMEKKFALQEIESKLSTLT